MPQILKSHHSLVTPIDWKLAALRRWGDAADIKESPLVGDTY